MAKNACQIQSERRALTDTFLGIPPLQYTSGQTPCSLFFHITMYQL